MEAIDPIPPIYNWVAHSTFKLKYDLYGQLMFATGSWTSEDYLLSSRGKLSDMSILIPGDTNRYVSRIRMYDENNTLFGDTSGTFFGFTVLDMSTFLTNPTSTQGKYKFQFDLQGGSTPTILFINGQFQLDGLYNSILSEWRTIIYNEFGSDFKIFISGTSEPVRDEQQPLIFITPMNINTAFNPIGHQTFSGHGEAQVWNFMLSFVVRRGVFVNGKSEAELLRDLGETMYKLSRNIEEDVDSYFLTTAPYIRYVYPGGLSTTLYNPETEQFRVDIDYRIEFNITR